MSTNELMTAEEIAAALRVKPATVRAWHKSGKIPGRTLGHKLIRYDLGQVVDALERASSAQACPCS